MKNDSLNNYLHKRLEDPDFKSEWEASEPQYQITRALIHERLTQKMSQRELARKANTTQAVVSRTESLTVNPSVGLLNKFATALGKKLTIQLE